MARTLWAISNENVLLLLNLFQEAKYTSTSLADSHYTSAKTKHASRSQEEQ